VGRSQGRKESSGSTSNRVGGVLVRMVKNNTSIESGSSLIYQNTDPLANQGIGDDSMGQS
jgi:hypothetical protein